MSTAVHTSLRTVYLAGPMRGYEDFNFPAFEAAASWLKSQGFDVFSPSARDLSDPDHPSNEEWREEDATFQTAPFTLAQYMAYDLKEVCSRDAVVCLPGWEESQGARLECMVSVEVNHPVFEITWEDGLALDPRATFPTGKLKLTSVSPDYVRVIFADRSLNVIEFEEEKQPPASTLPSESAARKAIPITTGVLDYFPDALVEVARVSKAGNDKHNPGQPLHHARSKSTDHADSLVRHMLDRGKIDGDTGCRHSAEVAWRALAMLQEELEAEGLASLPRGARE